MTNFVWRESAVQQIPSILVSKAEGFKDSPEYGRLYDYEVDIAGVVLGAFARYLCRIHDRKVAGHNSADLESAIRSAHEAIELLVSTREPAIHELVTDEIYENLDCKPEVLEHIKQHLMPQSLALYERWISRQ